MSNIVIPYRGLLTQLGDGPYVPPSGNLIGDWNPLATNVTKATVGNEEFVSRWDNSTNGRYMDQSSASARPTWHDGSGIGDIGKPYLRFNENATGSSSGVTWLELDTDFYAHTQVMTFYFVMDPTGDPDTYINWIGNSLDYDYDEGWRLGTDSSSEEMEAGVGNWPQNSMTLKSNWTSRRVVCYKFYRTSNESLRANRGGYTFGNDPVIWTSDTSYYNWNVSFQGFNQASNVHSVVCGTGRNGSGNIPYYGSDFNMYRWLVYDTYHNDSTSEDIMVALKQEYSTL